MAVAMAYDEAKTRQARHERSGKLSTGGLLNTPFFSFPNEPEMPHATLNKHDAGRYSSAHYHIRDQFQVVVDGKAKFGRHDVGPISVHFARAYTPYGPLNMDVKEGVTFFAMRAHRDA